MEEENKQKSMFPMYLLIIFLAIFVGTGAFMIVNRKDKNLNVNKEENTTVNKSIKQEGVVIPTSLPTQGSLSLRTSTTDSRFALKDGQVTVDLVGNSDSQNVGGYDVILTYDSLGLEFISATSALPDFKIYSYNKDSYMTFTGLQNLSSQPSPFKDTKLATFVFRPTKIGTFNLSLRSSLDKYKTDFVTDKTEILSPALKDLTVGVY